MAYTVERTSDEVLTLRHNDVAAGWSQDYLLISDVHFDSPHCDRRLLTRHLDQARERGAGVFVFGDWFDAMGGTNDKRATKETIRAEDKRNNYFDVLVDNSADYLAPYADLLVMMSDGNHETAITKHNETDLLARLCRQLGCAHMGYSGFVRFMFQGAKGNRVTRRMYFHHGAGGGGPVTKSMIDYNRKLVAYAADIYVGGHIHSTGYDENVRVRCTDSGKVAMDMEYLLTIPGYKQEHVMRGGYHIQNRRSARPQGGWWLHLFWEHGQPGNVGYKPERTSQ